MQFLYEGFNVAETPYTFDQLISFTRTSAATYVNSAGNVVTTPASKNLLTFTEEFDNAARGKLNGATITPNSTAAPDGTNTADTLVEAAATNIFGVRQSATLAAGTATFSVFIKPNGRNWVQLIVAAGGSGSAFFNVATGAVGTTSGATATVTSAGNGWYRCAITFTAASGSNTLDVRLASADNTTNYTGDGTSGLYLWGAQLEAGSTATSYVRNFGGLFPARFDYDPVTLQPRGLLIEEQRTNLLLRSEEFDNASWVKSDATIAANAATSPDGTANADTATPTSATPIVRQTHTTTTTGAYTGTIWLRSASSTNVTISLRPTGSGSPVSVVCAVTSTWQRFTVNLTAVAGLTNIQFWVEQFSQVIELWGAQLEAGSFATSYIPTVASQVTRTADQASIVAPNFAPWYNQSEGTFVAEWSSITTSASVANTSDGTMNNRITVQNDNGFQGAVLAGGASQASLDGGTLAAINKVAFAYKANDFALSFNGGAAVTDTSGSVPTVDRLILGANGAGTASFLNGHIRRIAYYPSRLSNAQLQALSA